MAKKSAPSLSDEIFIMEDDENTRRSVTRWLRAVGFRVSIANNATEVAKIVEKNKPSSKRGYILDINMGPGREQEGLAALDAIRAADKEAYVAILSGYPSRYATIAHRLGADVYKEKTHNINEDLLACLESYLEHKRQLDFKSRNATSPSSKIEPASNETPELVSSFDRVKMRKLMSQFLDLNDIESICFDLGIDYENLPTGAKDTKIRGLILYCERAGQTINLRDMCQEMRPNAEW